MIFLFQDELMIKRELQVISNIEQVIRDRFDDLQNRMNQSTTTLATHAVRCPSTLTVMNIDNYLKHFVRLHHHDLRRMINQRIHTLKDRYQEKQLFHELISHELTDTQVRIISVIEAAQVRLLSILEMFT